MKYNLMTDIGFRVLLMCLMLVIAVLLFTGAFFIIQIMASIGG